jgi:hypothetical protein
MTPEALDAAFRAETAPIGLWLDTTTLTIEQTVNTILDQPDASQIP